jgi:phosphoglycerol transferase MdoB-like AlkP superfamily enzyme
MKKRTAKSVARKVGAELAMVAFVLMVFFLCEKVFVLFHFKYEGSSSYRFLPIMLSAVPVMVLYALLRFVFSAYTSAIVTSVMTAAVSFANHVKFGLTGDPLSFTDISGTANISIVSNYTSASQIFVAAAAVLVGGFLLYRYEIPTLPSRFSRRRVPLGILSLVLLAGVLSGRPVADDLSSASSIAFTKLGMGYLSYDWPENMKLNGLGIHLVQTSVRHMPETPTAAETSEFNSLLKPARTDFERPKTVIMILCEACWNDDHHFKDVFAPLTNRELMPLRGVSPVYGGGTVNSAFEMTTGLPANGEALTGIIYQEYAPVISDTAHVLPRYLDKDGYRTVALHNHSKRFWNRDIVAPKFGYDEFLGIEDMTPTPPAGWADDEYLYNAALKEMDQFSKTPLFMHLTTVYTHGDYERRGHGDLGEAQYEEKLRLSIQRMATFVDQVYRRDPNAVLLVYGDHKPQLTAFFLREGVLPKSTFDRVGKLDMDFSFARGYSQTLVGDMPIYVKSSDSQKVADFISQANGMPFFCVSKFFDRTFLKSSAPVYRFSGDVCRSYRTAGYAKTIEAFPDWLYAKALLKS